ncbi:MAG: hypothetical protein RLN75_02080 [Longimicrobiales bacterium]
MQRPRVSLRRRVRRLSAAPLSAILAVGCGGGESPPASADVGEVAELALAAAEGSGEPFLSSDGDRLWLSWLEPAAGEAWALRLAEIGDQVSEPTTVVERDDFFVNWADFPSVASLPGGRLAAHWLQRGGEGTYDYGVRVAWSDDGGATWSDPWTPHEDGTPTEHGFVSLLPGDDGSLGVLWLDGRRYVDGPDGPETEEMTLRHRTASGPGAAGAEVLVDDRVCDCCQTGAAATTDGWVAVYRDRSEDEVRDIYAARFVDGAWTEGRPVHRDGWHIAACPVNGPAVDADGERVVVAWFTGAGQVPRVSLAFSDDQGVTFTEPVRIDEGEPVGRVDVVSDGDGALVSWIEGAGEGAELRVRRVGRDGTLGEPRVVVPISGARAAGFPRMVRHRDDLVFAWTDASGPETRVRAVRVTGRVR